ncbi:hypothetical protein [uncultured Alistipes sp.]|uniref:hypothetical protein n=1 Tax=uncultured Alistipes sp. TaxID=538949 RepID=UPI002606D0B8|nr:hypothetical protein [uncultured Alistipes sp.]
MKKLTVKITKKIYYFFLPPQQAHSQHCNNVKKPPCKRRRRDKTTPSRNPLRHGGAPEAERPLASSEGSVRIVGPASGIALRADTLRNLQLL